MKDGCNSLLLLGPPALRCGNDGEAVAFPQKAFVLLALLILSPERRIPRSALATTMYEEADQAGASANLRQLLSRIQIRQAALGVELVGTSRGEVRLSVDHTILDCDLGIFAGLEAPREALD